MSGLDFHVMHEMQAQLQEKYSGKWPAITPAIAREKLLWMMIEAGEMADIIKKKGDAMILEQGEVRAHFVEEMCDTLMYFNDVMRCYGITPEEFEKAYTEKHRRNMVRW